MQESFLAEGYLLVGWDDSADVRVINTCTVTAKSDRTCRREIRLAKRLDPECLVAVTGCYAEVAPEAVEALPEADIVLGNAEKLRLVGYVRGALSGDPDDVGSGLGGGGTTERRGGAGLQDEFITHFYGYTRAFLKIQTGCDSRCAYCIIPVARGAARSMPARQVIEQVRVLAARDYREVVLTGINLGTWGRDTGEGGLADLLGRLLRETTVDRLRLSSIEPLEMEQPLLRAIAEGGERIAHHFHLPLQSGSDEILRRMNRPYSTADYLRITGEVARRFPEAALGADVIVGFPGETEEHFAQTCRLVETSPLTYLHVFAYSDRPGTAASSMRGKVPPEITHERSARLRELGRTRRQEFEERMAGSRQRALVLHERAPDGSLLGLTGNYTEVLVAGGEELINRFVRGSLKRRSDGAWLLDDMAVEDQT